MDMQKYFGDKCPICGMTMTAWGERAACFNRLAGDNARVMCRRCMCIEKDHQPSLALDIATGITSQLTSPHEISFMNINKPSGERASVVVVHPSDIENIYISEYVLGGVISIIVAESTAHAGYFDVCLETVCKNMQGRFKFPASDYCNVNDFSVSNLSVMFDKLYVSCKENKTVAMPQEITLPTATEEHTLVMETEDTLLYNVNNDKTVFVAFDKKTGSWVSPEATKYAVKCLLDEKSSVKKLSL